MASGAVVLRAGKETQDNMQRDVYNLKQDWESEERNHT